jgi:hypothetical protein
MTNKNQSSRYIFDNNYWENFNDINLGKVVSWIFINEDKGSRHKG